MKVKKGGRKEGRLGLEGLRSGLKRKRGKGGGEERGGDHGGSVTSPA